MTTDQRDGALVLLPDGAGGHRRRGSWQSPVIKAPRVGNQLINALLVALRGEIPPGTMVRVFIRSCRGEERGQWRHVPLEGDLTFDQTVEDMQYRVELIGNGRSSPRVRGLSALAGLVRTGTMAGNDASGNVTVADGSSNDGGDGANGDVGQDDDREPVPVGNVSIVSRQEWGAASARNNGTAHRPTSIVIHHSASAARDYHGAATVRQFQRLHQQERGWADIGYHFLVGPDGVVYQGRPAGTVGAHAAGANTGRLGISLIGNYDTDQITAESWQSLVQLTRQLSRTYGIAPTRSGAIVGHCDLNSTGCPGATLYGSLAALRQQAAESSPTD